METLDHENKQEEPRPQSFFTLMVLSIIGNGLWILLFVVAFGMLDEVLVELQKSYLFDDVSEARRILAIVFSIIILLCVGCIVGHVLMYQRKRAGFWIYAVCNGLFALLVLSNLGNGNIQPIFVGLISVGFIIGFSRHLKWMR